MKLTHHYNQQAYSSGTSCHPIFLTCLGSAWFKPVHSLKVGAAPSSHLQLVEANRQILEAPSCISNFHHISPHWAITTSWFGFSLVVRVFSIFLTTSMPSTTLPNTTCLLLRKGVGTVVIKNWHPLVSLPEFCIPVSYLKLLHKTWGLESTF